MLILWGIALLASLAWGCALPVMARVSAMVAAVVALWPSIVALGARDPLVLGLRADGQWWLRRPREAVKPVRISHRPLVLGSCIWIALEGDAGRSFLFIDGHQLEPMGLWRLKVVLRANSGAAPPRF
jgi:hypothetical protein